MKASQAESLEKVHFKRDRAHIAISSLSLWKDDVWIFDNSTFGASRFDARLPWAFELPDGTNFSDREWSDLRETLKIFVWSLYSDPREGLATKPGTTGIIGIGIRYLVRWMALRGFVSLSDLDRSAADLFIDDIIENVYEPESAAEKFRTRRSDGEETDEPSLRFPMSRGGIVNRLNAWRLLWRQSSAMKDAGCSYLPERPFDLPVTTIAENLSAESIKLTPALPDEVSVPIMNAAERFLQHCAPDIVRLHRMYLSAILDEGLLHHKSSSARNAKAKRAIDSFIFSTVPGESRPWREKIADMSPIIYRNPAMLGSTESATVDAIHHLRALLFDVRDACALIIQSQAGVRISELCSIEAGTSPTTGLPSCIEVRKSKTGLNELFYLKGRISKTVRAPLEVEWILGSRPYGSPELPSPVKAVAIIEELFSHWRKFAREPKDEMSLFVTFLCRRGFPKSEKQVIAATSGSIADGQNLFIRKYIDLSSLPPTSRHGEDLSRFREVSSSPIRTHQWRKSYALYIFKTDSRMIPAIAQQFHHVSLAMTEQGYLSNDPELLEAIDSARKESTAAYFYRFITESPKLSGRLAKIIDDHKSEISSLISAGSRSESITKISAWIEERGLHIFFGSHGKCFMRLNPTEARCHKIAGTSSWLNQQPNYLTREPGVCVGCSCFVVDDDHLPFWKSRYEENQSAVDMADRYGKGAEYRVVRERAAQASAVLLSLGIDVGKKC